MTTTAERSIEAQIRSASKVEPGRLPRLKLLGEAWAEAVKDGLADICTTPIDAECVGLSSLTLGAGAPEAKDAAFCLMLKSTKWLDAGFILADGMIADVFAEAIFGGPGRRMRARSAQARPMTSLDRSFAQKGLAAFAELANPIFGAVAPLDLRPDLALASGIAEELDELLAAENRSFVLLSFALTLGELSTTLRVAIPDKAFSTHKRALSTLPERVSSISDEAWAKNIQEGLQHADLQVRALLDERQITLGEVSRFAVGQTIVLDATMESLIVVECEEQRLFRGRMGMTRDAYVVRIEEKIDPTEEFIDDILAD